MNKQQNEKALEIKGLVKSYHNGTQALKGIDLAVNSGDFFALLGHNGAGKSTTIGIISSLVNKTSGSVKVFGLDLDTQKQQARLQIGVVPQEFNFNQFEKIEDILMYQAGFFGVSRKEAQLRAEKWLKKLDLWEKRKALAITLSGGMKRRLMIARALMHNPKLLILDEPTAGVDIEIRRALWDFLKELNEQGTTIILTTHYFEEAELLCKNIAILQRGEVVENISMKNLLAKLDIDTLVLDLDSQAPTNIEGFAIRIVDENTIEVDVKREQGVNELFKKLDDLSIKVLSLRNKSNRLESYFVGMESNNE